MTFTCMILIWNWRMYSGRQQLKEFAFVDI